MGLAPGATFSNVVQNPMGMFGSMGGLGLGLDGQPQGLPRGHGRRHSVNVVNKPNANLSITNAYGVTHGTQDGFDDGFVPPNALGGHSRQASRVDPGWRMSRSLLALYGILFSFDT